MKIINSLLLLLLLTLNGKAKENTYTGSTPADRVIRLFLDIPLTDSIDFIRWQLILDDKHYTLNCNYGISKPNTNGFINGGKKIILSGAVSKEENYYRLQNRDKSLKIVEINRNLLQLLDISGNLLAGNSGWSYTLNNITPVPTDHINIKALQTVLKDSIEFQGRTPCGVPGVIPEGMLCYKLKWYIVLYTDAINNEQGTYKVFGTPYRDKGGRKGTWRTVIGKDGRMIYQLNDENGNGFLYLLKLNENVLIFTDEHGNLLVGNEDFSYTVNKVNK